MAAMRSAATSAWAGPSRPGAGRAPGPGSILPVVGVVPWRTSSTTVGRRRPAAAAAARGGAERRDRADGGHGKPIVGSAPWRPTGAEGLAGRGATRRGGLPPLPAPGALARGGGAAPAGPPSPGRPTGAAACPASATPRRRWSSSAWPRPPTAPTGPGRMFTGDRSGDWLFAALHRAGYASQPTSTSRRRRPDADRAPTSRPRCTAPRRPTSPTPPSGPRARPTWPASSRCSTRAAVVRGAGAVGLAGAWPPTRPAPAPGLRPPGRVTLPDGGSLLGSYHPSQQNTFTGTLTEPMFDAVFARARQLIDRRLTTPGRRGGGRSGCARGRARSRSSRRRAPRAPRRSSSRCSRRRRRRPTTGRPRPARRGPRTR